MKIFKSGEMTHAVFTNKYFLTSSTCVWRQQKFRGWNFKRQSVRFLSLRYHFYFNSISKNMFHSQNRTSTTGASGPLVARGPLLESLQLSSNMCETRFYCQVIINWYSSVLIVSKIVTNSGRFIPTRPKVSRSEGNKKWREANETWFGAEEKRTQIRSEIRTAFVVFFSFLLLRAAQVFGKYSGEKKPEETRNCGWNFSFCHFFFFYPDAVSVGTRQNVRDPYPH